MVGNHPVKFCHFRHGDSADKLVLVCHVIFQEHLIQGSWYFIARSPFTILPILVPIDIVAVDI